MLSMMTGYCPRLPLSQLLMAPTFGLNRPASFKAPSRKMGPGVMPAICAAFPKLEFSWKPMSWWVGISISPSSLWVLRSARAAMSGSFVPANVYQSMPGQKPLHHQFCLLFQRLPSGCRERGNSAGPSWSSKWVYWTRANSKTRFDRCFMLSADAVGTARTSSTAATRRAFMLISYGQT